jgi:5'(3')-deoxyribonucleotidase
VRQLYLDLDGVLGDFDGFLLSTYGIITDRTKDDPPNFWETIASHPTGFFRAMPMLPDAMELWEGAKRLHPSPIVLSGAPHSVPDAHEQKKEWVREKLGPDVQTICCAAAQKRIFCKPGDVLIDDWPKYRDLWRKAGGIFILHTTAKSSLEQAEPYFVIR